MGIESSGEWLEKALMELCKRIETGIDLDAEIISGLVSYCEMASPLDAKEYLDNIIGEDTGKTVTEEYLKRRGHLTVSNSAPTTPNLQAYVKPRTDPSIISAKKPHQWPHEASNSSNRDNRTKVVPSEPTHNTHPPTTRKKKSGKVVSLAEAAKGSIIFQKGKPCSCQARRHMLINNCLSCGRIVCEQEGEGLCNFCGALVLKEGSTYAGLDEGVVLTTDAEAAAEAYAKRLVDYDRNSAARTTVIDDQSDYYEMEGNTWLSNEIFEPLVKVLRMVDGDSPSMTFVYGELLEAKKKIMQATVPNENSCIMDGVFDCVETFYGDDDIQTIMLNDELPKFKKQQGAFGKLSAKKGCEKITFNPANWWETFGCHVPHLQRLTIKIMSLTLSASDCERNWSTFDIEKELLRKKKELEEAERTQRSKVVMTVDLLGRKVLLKENEAFEEMQNSILLRPPDAREEVRIKPNPNLKIQPVFIDPGHRKADKGKSLTSLSSTGLCLERSGRVQHGSNELGLL